MLQALAAARHLQDTSLHRWYAGPQLSPVFGWNKGLVDRAALYTVHPKAERVMSMLYYTLIIAFLIGIQAAPKTKDHAPAGSSAKHRIQHHHTHRTKSLHRHHGRIETNEPASSHNITVDPKLFRKRKFRSPRVLFSTQPPPLSEDLRNLEYLDDEESLNKTIRAKRTVHPVLHRGEYSVCDSVSMWVGEKTTATDIKGKEVTVLGEVNINNNVFKQYFFETRCRDPKPVSSGCRGIDSKHWNSYCTTTHTFVKALTMEGKQAAWRFIRIDTACVCVLSRKGRP
ncbi:beta-nerve growth factor isoform X3 [Ranitomeya variabilis]|uniref:beta-nerve growth factor isoform X3 n=1 Tax=Ranitomeya variabilis TaxID=490064 RepID=UPI0040573F09